MYTYMKYIYGHDLNKSGWDEIITNIGLDIAVNSAGYTFNNEYHGSLTHQWSVGKILSISGFSSSQNDEFIQTIQNTELFDVNEGYDQFIELVVEEIEHSIDHYIEDETHIFKLVEFIDYLKDRSNRKFYLLEVSS